MTSVSFDPSTAGPQALVTSVSLGYLLYNLISHRPECNWHLLTAAEQYKVSPALETSSESFTLSLLPLISSCIYWQYFVDGLCSFREFRPAALWQKNKASAHSHDVINVWGVPVRVGTEDDGISKTQNFIVLIYKNMLVLEGNCRRRHSHHWV